jgi:hypothetical protein
MDSRGSRRTQLRSSTTASRWFYSNQLENSKFIDESMKWWIAKRWEDLTKEMLAAEKRVRRVGFRMISGIMRARDQASLGERMMQAFARQEYLIERSYRVPIRWVMMSDMMLWIARRKRMKRERLRAPGGLRFPFYNARQTASLGWDTDSNATNPGSGSEGYD